jgi:uncharacterized membrane protein YbhN (UPF0104 family)
VSRTARLLVSALLLGVLAWRADWGQLRSAAAGLDPLLWLAAAVLYVATQCVSSYRWQVMARPLGFDLPWRRFAGLFYVGTYFNLMLPTSVGGDVVRAWQLGGTGRRSAALLSVLVERGSGLLVLLLLAVAATLGSPRPLEPWVTASVFGLAGCAAAGLLGLAVAGRLTRRRLGPDSRLGRLRAAGAEAWRVYRRRPGLVLTATGLSVYVQAVNVVVVWLIDRALGMGVPLSYYAIAVPVVTLLTLLPVSLNGMGVREAAMGLMLGPVGVAPTLAGSLAFLWFGVQVAAGLTGGVVYLCGRYAPPPAAEPAPAEEQRPERRAA